MVVAANSAKLGLALGICTSARLQTCMRSGMVVAANSAKLGLALGICTSYGCGIVKHFCAAPFKCTCMVKVVAHTLVC